MRYMFYPCTCYGDKWQDDISKTFVKLKNSELYNKLDKIFINFSLTPDIDDVDMPEACVMDKVQRRISHKYDYSASRAEFCSNSQSETLDLLWKFCNKLESNSHILYMHNEGVCEKFTREWLFDHLDDERIQNVEILKDYLDHWTIDKLKECTDQLNTHGSCGPYLMLEELVHYFGNHWWANSMYINTLNKPDTDKDLFPDYWLLSSLYANKDVSEDNMDYFKYGSKRDFYCIDHPELNIWNYEPWKNKIDEKFYTG